MAESTAEAAKGEAGRAYATEKGGSLPAPPADGGCHSNAGSDVSAREMVAFVRSASACDLSRVSDGFLRHVLETVGMDVVGALEYLDDGSHDIAFENEQYEAVMRRSAARDVRSDEEARLSV